MALGILNVHEKRGEHKYTRHLLPFNSNIPKQSPSNQNIPDGKKGETGKRGNMLFVPTVPLSCEYLLNKQSSVISVPCAAKPVNLDSLEFTAGKHFRPLGYRLFAVSLLHKYALLE